GLSANLVGVTPEKAIKLAVNDYCRARFSEKLGVTPENLPLQYGLASGAVAGSCQVIATNPMEITKIKMQLSAVGEPEASSGPKASGGVRSVKQNQLVQTVWRLGFKGLYRGSLSTLCRDVP